MGMFYCTAHDCGEDSDFVGYEVTNAGEEFCHAAYAATLYDAEPYVTVAQAS